MDIAENIRSIRTQLPENVRLICVSKFHPASMIQKAYEAGERFFAESRPQELVEKVDILPKDIKWHFIGNLQTNKVKMVVPNAELIHSVSNVRLFDEIEKCAAKIDKVQNVLIELHVAREESKQGFTPEEAKALISQNFLDQHKHVRVCGVMGMASFTEDQDKINEEFGQIANTFKFLKSNIFSKSDYFKEISMGMSGDYKLAIEKGSTMVRIGSAIFGERSY